MNKLRSFSLIGRWLPAMLLAAFVLPVPHAKAVTAADCSGRYDTSDPLTVKDNDTKLTWEKTADSMPRDWTTAQSHCQSLPPAGAWRLPNIFELQTIVDESVNAPSLDPAFDPAGANGIYWSSTWYADNPGTHAWAIDFGMTAIGGTVKTQTKISTLRVRCVR